MIKNIFFIAPYKNIYITPVYKDFHSFELQLLHKNGQILNNLLKYTFTEIIDNINIKADKSNIISIKHSLKYLKKDIKQTDINIIFKHNILSKILDINWSILENELIITVENKNKDIITKDIELLCISTKNVNITISSSKTHVRTEIINSPFKLLKILSVPDKNKYIIPRVIMQTYKSGNVSKEMIDSSKSWSLCNPSYRFEFYDDKRCIEFLKTHFSNDIVKSFNSLIPGAFKADLFRYCYLYINGGVYTDIDNICMINLNTIINDKDTFISVKDRPVGCIYNAFMMCAPKSHILETAISNIIINVKKQLYPQIKDSLLSITGPKCLGMALNYNLNRNPSVNFEYGDNNINNIKFKLFKFTDCGRYITTSEQSDIYKIIATVKYDGYDNGGSYVRLFNNRNVYKKIIDV